MAHRGVFLTAPPGLMCALTLVRCRPPSAAVGADIGACGRIVGSDGVGMWVPRMAWDYDAVANFQARWMARTWMPCIQLGCVPGYAIALGCCFMIHHYRCMALGCCFTSPLDDNSPATFLPSIPPLLLDYVMSPHPLVGMCTRAELQSATNRQSLLVPG